MSKSSLNIGRLKQKLKALIKGGPVQTLSAREDALKHMAASFGDEGTALFDEAFYLAQNADVAAAGTDPFWHYLHIGAQEGRAPSASFDGKRYLEIHEDVRALGINPLLHYIEFGFAEGRASGGATTDAGFEDMLKTYFDRDFYLSTYPDVAAAGIDPLRHYLESGWQENRNPSAQFNTRLYLNTYESAREYGKDPLTHYIKFGQKQGYVIESAAAEGVTADVSPAVFEQPVIDESRWALKEYDYPGARGAAMIIETFDGGLLRGVAYNPGTHVPDIEVLSGKKQILASISAMTPTPLAAALEMPGLSGFAVTLPLAQRYENPNSIQVRFRGKPSTARSVEAQGRAHPRALFIANASNAADGSRIYRSDLPAQQLRASGVECQVFGQEDAFARVVGRQLHPGDFDVVIMQRVPAIASSLNIVELARRKKRLVLYDVDDLMFKPWRRAEMGVIRSGMVKMDDAVYAESLLKRLKLMTLCDGVICSTPFLQRELNSLGLSAILSRNAVDDRNFVAGALRLAAPPSENFRMMFMSGTPTHDADFAHIKDVVRDILARNSKVTLTILGELRDRDLDSLPNVVRLAAVPRHQMFNIVAQQDLVLVPLERTSFNTAKSSLKFMECGASGVPVIASNLFEFERDIRASGAGMIAKTPEDWRKSIQAYIDKPDLAREHGFKAFRYCKDNYSVSSREGYLWNEICRFDHYISQRERAAQSINLNIGSYLKERA